MFPTILSLFFDFLWVSEFSSFSLSQIFNHWFPSVSASLYYFYQSPKHYNSSHSGGLFKQELQFSLVQLSLHSKLCHINAELQVVYTCTSMVRVSCTKLPVLRFAWQSLWTVLAKSQCLQMLIADSPGLSRTLTDTAQMPGFTYESPNLLDKMAFELFWVSSPPPPSPPPPSSKRK